MEKKGDLLNQLAIVSDLLEKVNAEIESQTIVLELSKTEFNKVFKIIEKKYGKAIEIPTDTFTINMGVVNIIFNTNNV
jgi:hypothetical protein